MIVTHADVGLVSRARLALYNFALEDEVVKRSLSRLRYAWARRFAGPRGHLDALVRYLLYNFQGPDTRRVVDEAMKVCGEAFSELGNDGESSVLYNSILAKPWISPREKGMLWIGFEAELMKLAASPTLPRLAARYHIVFLPTWQPFYSIPFVLLLSRMREPFWLMPSSARDVAVCQRLGCHCIALPFHASSWVLPEQFHDRTARDIDILMVANFSRYKRHWLLFKALRDLPSTLNVVLAGRPWGGRTRESLVEEAAAYGVADRFAIIESPSDATIAQLMTRARLLCALSHKEGSYIAVAEALMAGTPVGMYEDAVIGSKDYINPETGVLFRRSEPLAPQIRRFLEASSKLCPERWARENISCHVNIRRLNKLVAQQCRERGLEWTQDLSPLQCKNFAFHYLDPLDEMRMAQAYDDLERNCGIRIARPVTLRAEFSGMTS